MVTLAAFMCQVLNNLKGEIKLDSKLLFISVLSTWFSVGYILQH
jgi:hypothetical protein